MENQDEKEARLWEQLDKEDTSNDNHHKNNFAVDGEEDLFMDLKSLNAALKEQELQSPSAGFSARVLQSIHAERSQVVLKKKGKDRVVMAISGFFIVSILVCLTFYFTGYYQNEGPIFELSRRPEFSKLSSARENSITVFMFMNIILALVLTDQLLKGNRLKATR